MERLNRITRRITGRKAGIALFFFAASFVCIPASAGDGACYELFQVQDDRIKVKVNTAGLSGFANNISDEDFIDAVGKAIEVYNSQSNAVDLVYDGTTTATSASCSSTLGYSLIRTIDAGSNNNGGPQCAGEQFRANIYSKPFGSSTPREWGSGTFELGSGSAEQDLVSTLVHEIGHGIGLGHPYNGPSNPASGAEGWLCTSAADCNLGLICKNLSSGDKCTDNEGAVMNGRLSSPKTTRRTLYEYDRQCLDESRSPRDFTPRRRYIQNGAIGASSSFLASGNVAKANAGASVLGGSWTWTSGVHLGALGGGFLETSSQTTLETVSQSPTGWMKSGMVPITTRGYSSTNVTMVWVDGRDSVATSSTYLHDLHEFDSVQVASYARSTDGFDGTDSFGFLRHCSAMSSSSNGSNLICAGQDSHVKTAYPVAHSYLDGVDQTIVAWLHHTRTTDQLMNEVKVSVGFENTYTLSLPDSLGIYSGAPPGLACKNNMAAGGADCILIYTDAQTRSNEMYSQRFSVAYQHIFRRYTVVKVGLPILVKGTGSWDRRTAAKITAWHHDGMFWLAYKTMETGQSTKVLSSTDGIGDGDSRWDFESQLSHSVEGPSTAGALHGTNMIVTLE